MWTVVFFVLDSSVGIELTKSTPVPAQDLPGQEGSQGSTGVFESLSV
jgi:hypothetical protein